MTAAEIDRITLLEGKVAALTAAVDRLARRVRMGRDLAALAKVAPDLLAMRTHAEQLAELASVAPVLVGIATTGQDEMIFRKVLRQKFGWMSGNRVLRAGLVAVIGGAATVGAEKVLGIHG